eukprot:gb/GEZN01011919.1/.p1 GENE.gb/GEZN01011919.1/~~gb/GEZN01011919.1/.p1  ORF type:complete len:231 (-),score=40.07 gb/GEZN01011919.1/:341-1033(-)
MALLSVTSLLLLLQSALFPLCGAVYFYMEEAPQAVPRCFLEEVAQDVLVVANYESPDYQLTLDPTAGHGVAGSPNQPQLTLIATVLDPKGIQIMYHELEASGKFAFTSQTGGQHQICIGIQQERWSQQKRKFRLSLSFDTGEHAVDYQIVAKQEHLSAIEVEIRKLNDKIRAIRAEQAYQKRREAAFRGTSDSTNQRVMWWSIIQTLFMVASGVFQIFNLKKFFKSKKLA